jgi:hypothetical protein
MDSGQRIGPKRLELGGKPEAFGERELPRRIKRIIEASQDHRHIRMQELEHVSGVLEAPKDEKNREPPTVGVGHAQVCDDLATAWERKKDRLAMKSDRSIGLSPN